MKRILIIFLILCFLPIKISAMDLSATAAVLIDADSGRILYSKNSDKIMKPASTTKIMTALIALSKAQPDEIVKVSPFAASQEGSSMYLAPGEQVSMRDLVYGLMLPSGNDAAVAIAEHISGSSDKFAQLMTQTARELGCKNTAFKNPNGLDADGHHTTAYELAQITREALKNPVFCEIAATSNYTDTSGRSFSNHNKLLYMYDGCTGVKTGFTKKSGRTLVSSATRNGVSLIAVTLNAPDDWNDHTKMFDLGFSSYALTHIISTNQPFGDLPVHGSTKPYVSAVYKQNISAVLSPDEAARVEISTICSDTLDAPIAVGQVLGEAVVCLDGVILGKTQIIADTQALLPPAKSFISSLRRVFLEWLLCPRQNKNIT